MCLYYIGKPSITKQNKTCNFIYTHNLLLRLQIKQARQTTVNLIKHNFIWKKKEREKEKKKKEEIVNTKNAF